MLLINVNVQVAKLSMAMFVLLIAQLVNFIIKLLKNVYAQLDKTGMEIFVFTVMEVKLGIQL